MVGSGGKTRSNVSTIVNSSNQESGEEYGSFRGIADGLSRSWAKEGEDGVNKEEQVGSLLGLYCMASVGDNNHLLALTAPVSLERLAGF